MPETILAMGAIKSSKVIPEIRNCPVVECFGVKCCIILKHHGEVDLIISSILLMKKLKLREAKCCA